MYKIRFYCPDCVGYCYAEQETLTDVVTCPTHPSAIIRDFVVMEDMNKTIYPNRDTKLDEGGINEVSATDLKDAVNKKHDVSLCEGYTKSHDQNTDLYLDTQITNTLYVDWNRNDSYTENGSITKPFKTVQAAIDSISGSSATNRFEIRLPSGNHSSENILINKSYINIIGENYTRLAGDITISSSPVKFSRVRLRGNITTNIENHFLIELDHCIATTGTYNISPITPTGDEWLQIYGGLLSPTINATNVQVMLGNGIYQSRTINIVGGSLHSQGMVFCSATINLESNADCKIGASITDMATTVNIKTGAILKADAGFLGFATVNNIGGTLTRITKGSGIDNDSSITGATVKDALETLDKSKVTFNCPAITIANDENIQIYRFTTNLNAKIKVFVAGISNLEGGLPANSYIQIYNETDLQVEYQANSRFVSGNPIAELSLSQKDISIRATNGTGGAIDLHAFITITQE